MAVALHQRHHVLLADPAAAAGAGDGVEVDPVLGGDPLDDGGVPPACGRPIWSGFRGRRGLALKGRRRGRPGLKGRRRGRLVLDGGRRPVAGRDPRQHDPNVDRRIDVHQDLGHDAGNGRRHLGVDLVGRDLANRLLGLDPVSDLGAPGDDRTLGHRDAHLRHRHIDQSVSTQGAHGKPPSHGRRRAGQPARAAARTGSARRASPLE